MFIQSTLNISKSKFFLKQLMPQSQSLSQTTQSQSSSQTIEADISKSKFILKLPISLKLQKLIFQSQSLSSNYRYLKVKVYPQTTDISQTTEADISKSKFILKLPISLKLQKLIFQSQSLSSNYRYLKVKVYPQTTDILQTTEANISKSKFILKLPISLKLQKLISQSQSLSSNYRYLSNYRS